MVRWRGHAQTQPFVKVDKPEEEEEHRATECHYAFCVNERKGKNKKKEKSILTVSNADLRRNVPPADHRQRGTERMAQDRAKRDDVHVL